MPGLDPSERLNIGLVPQSLQVLLGLVRARAQFVVGTSDSGAQAFAEAVRAARTAERPSTILVLAGQVIPTGYTSQYQIRTVLGEDDQARGLDMLAVGDSIMDAQRRAFRLSPEEIRAAAFAGRAAQGAGRRQLSGGDRLRPSLQAQHPAHALVRRRATSPSPCGCGAAATIITSDEAASPARLPSVRLAEIPHRAAHRGARGRRTPAPPTGSAALQGAAVFVRQDCTARWRPPPTTRACLSRPSPPRVRGGARRLSQHRALVSPRARARLRAQRRADGGGLVERGGGLLNFGHGSAPRASCRSRKAHDVFCIDCRYLREADARQGFARIALSRSPPPSAGRSRHVRTLFPEDGKRSGRRCCSDGATRASRRMR